MRKSRGATGVAAAATPVMIGLRPSIHNRTPLHGQLRPPLSTTAEEWFRQKEGEPPAVPGRPRSRSSRFSDGVNRLRAVNRLASVSSQNAYTRMPGSTVASGMPLGTEQQSLRPATAATTTTADSKNRHRLANSDLRPTTVHGLSSMPRAAPTITASRSRPEPTRPYTSGACRTVSFQPSARPVLSARASTGGLARPSSMDNIIPTSHKKRALDFMARSSAYCGDVRVNYYDLLKVSPKATTGEIKAAFRQMALRVHPDKTAQLDDDDEELLLDGKRLSDQDRSRLWLQLADANTVLTDPRARNDYDLARALNQALQRQQQRVDLEEKQKKLNRQRAAHASRSADSEPRSSSGEQVLTEEVVPSDGQPRADLLPKGGRIDVDVYLPEHVLSMGGTKVVPFNQARVMGTGRMVLKEKHFTLNVRRGAEDGDYVEFMGQGHQTRDCSPGDVRFVFRTSHQHTLFQTRLRKTIKEVQLAAGKRKPFMKSVAKSLEPSAPFVSLIRSA